MRVSVRCSIIDMHISQSVILSYYVYTFLSIYIYTGMFGGLQNYLCYSNSLLYYKCQGRGKVSGYFLAALTVVFFYYGPTIVYYIPR